MKTMLSRRDFLKIASLSPLLFTKTSSFESSPRLDNAGMKPNIIIILFDAMSARNLSLYGYPRRTTPNLERFANRSTVYHSHYSAGNFTSPGVASLLTGTYPWTHRAFNPAGVVREAYRQDNLFRYFEDGYECTAFSQNFWADIILFQFDEYIDAHHNSGEFSLINGSFYNNWFRMDAKIAFNSLDRFLFNAREIPGSFFLSFLDRKILADQYREYCTIYREEYPRGIPNLIDYNLFYLLESVTDGAISIIKGIKVPSLVYLHFFSPHEPYFPRQDFIGIFNDKWEPQGKKEHFFSEGFSDKSLNELRKQYDEYIAHTDAEFGRLFDSIKQTNLLNNSYIIVTSDHGQLFERGVHGHVTPLLYEPVIRVPLLISSPGRQTRDDVYSITSCVDLLPTLLHYVGQPIPEECEGQTLPRLGGTGTEERSIYVVEAKKNPVNGPLNISTLAIIKDQYKLISYKGYPGYENGVELYNLANDPEELEDISHSKRDLAKELYQDLEKRNSVTPDNDL